MFIVNRSFELTLVICQGVEGKVLVAGWIVYGCTVTPIQTVSVVLRGR
jgi:hypothetical protein